MIHPLAVSELWSEWLKDEIPLACIPEQRDKVKALFERAVKDYQCKLINLVFILHMLVNKLAATSLRKNE